MLEGAFGAVAAFFTAGGEAAHLVSDVGTGEGTPLAGPAFPVQTSSRAASLWDNTRVSAQLWPALPSMATSVLTPRPAYSPQYPPSHSSPVVQTIPSLGCAPQGQCHTLPQAPLPESGYFLLHMPVTGLGKGQCRGDGTEEVKGTYESASEANMGIRQGQTPVGAHLCRPGCGRCGSGGQAQGRGAGRTSGSGAAPLPRKKHCSPPRGPRSPTPQAQGSRAPPGTAGRPPYRCWGQGRGLQKTAPWPTPTRAPTARLCSPPPPCSS